MKPRTSAWGWWAVTLVYYAIGCLMHLQFSLWLVRRRDTALGSIAYADAVPMLAVAVAAGLLVWLAVRIPGSARPRQTLAFWFLWLAAAVLIDRYLTYTTNEYAHYPQYAALAWLVARAMDPQRTRWYVGRVLFWTTLLGMGDELLQYLWITTTYSDYLDFNDFLTNLVAAAAGMLLYYGTGGRPLDAGGRRKPVAEIAVAAALAGVVAAALMTGHIVQTPPGKIPPGGIVRGAEGSPRLYLQRAPGLYGAWQPSQRHVRYHVLAPVPGLLVMLAAGLLFSSFGRAAPRGVTRPAAFPRSPSSAAAPLG